MAKINVLYLRAFRAAVLRLKPMSIEKRFGQNWTKVNENLGLASLNAYASIYRELPKTFSFDKT